MADLGEILKRYEDMRSERDRFLTERDTCDLQFEAETYEDNRGNLYVNSPIEQNLIEMELGRTSGLPMFDVQPDGYKADVQKLETARYILSYFIDKEQRYKENRTWKMDKAKYGSGIFFTGIRMEIDIVPEYGDKEHDNNYTAFWDHKQTTDKKQVKWFFTPKNVPIRMFLFDDRAMWQSDFKRVEDCVMLEFLSKEELEQRYGDNKYFNQDQIKEAVESQVEEGEYGIQTQQPMVVLYHYFNRVTKQYAIVMNKTETIFDGKMLYPDGCLPFVFCQHYPNNACMYGISIPRKVRAEKAYTNNMKQYMLDGARLGSGKILAMGNSGEVVDGNLMVSAGQVNIARFSNSIEQVKEISTGVDLNGPLAVLNMLRDDVRINTGIDINAVFEPPAEQLGTVEIIEENKQIRNKSVDELMDFAYDEALTKMLDNIATFAPRLLKTTKIIKDKKGKIVKKIAEYPTLQLPNVKITKKKGRQYIEEEMGEYGYLDFTPETLQGGMCVRVVTGTTANTKMQIIEKNKNNEFMKQYTELTQVRGPEKMEEVFPVEQVMEKWKVSYGYDDARLVADTKKDKTKRENEEKIALLKQLITNEPTTTDGATQEQPVQGGGGGMQMPEVGATTIEEANEPPRRGTQRVQAEVGTVPSY